MFVYFGKSSISNGMTWRRVQLNKVLNGFWHKRSRRGRRRRSHTIVSLFIYNHWRTSCLANEGFFRILSFFFPTTAPPVFFPFLPLPPPLPAFPFLSEEEEEEEHPLPLFFPLFAPFLFAMPSFFFLVVVTFFFFFFPVLLFFCFFLGGGGDATSASASEKS